MPVGVQRRGNSTAAQLLTETDAGPYDLRPDNPADLHDLMNEVDQAVDRGVNARTAKGNPSHPREFHMQ